MIIGGPSMLYKLGMDSWRAAIEDALSDPQIAAMLPMIFKTPPGSGCPFCDGVCNVSDADAPPC